MSKEKRMNTIQIQKSMAYKVTGVTFATVAAACNFGMTNIPSSFQEELEQYIAELGLAHTPHVLVATHSFGEREWTFEKKEGVTSFFSDEGPRGGWYIFTSEDIKRLRFVSKTSGSAITAEKKANNLWDLTLEVPIDDDGQPYQGHYYHCFMEAVENLGQEYLSHGVTLVAEGDNPESGGREISICRADTDFKKVKSSLFSFDAARGGLWAMWVFTSQGVITKLLWKFQGGNEAEESVEEAELGGITFRVGEAIPEEATNTAAQCMQ